MKIFDYQKLERLDTTMNELNHELTRDNLYENGKILNAFDLLDEKDEDDIQKIIAAYQNFWINRLQTILSTNQEKSSLNLQFNQQVLQSMLDNITEDDHTFIQNAINNFKRYAITAANQKNFNEDVKQTNPNSYIEEQSHYDRRRTRQHNACITNISFLNNLSKDYSQNLFMNLPKGYNDIDEINRTDIGSAVFRWNIKNVETDNTGFTIIK